jgi:hypothetical protein
MNAPVYLASCAACGASGVDGGGATTYACEVPQPDPFYCPKCRPGLIPADELAQVDQCVGLLAQRPEASWVVLVRDGDIVSIRPLGLPSFPARTVTVGEIRPKFSYQRLAAAKHRQTP